MFRFPLKLVMYLSYLVILLVVAGVITYRTRSFEGVIVIEKGRAEHWAVEPFSRGGGLFAFARRGTPGELIAFDNPRAVTTLLDKQASYVAVELPFRLVLKQVDILKEGPMREELELLYSGKRFQIDATPGATVDIPEGRLTVQSVEPWSGLLRDGRGTPMALAAIRKTGQDWQAPMFIAPEEDLRPLPDMLIQFRAYPNEQAARAAVPEKAPAPKTLRWGVHEDKRVHWFDGLAPGTGVTTTNGTEYTLLDANVSGRGRDYIRVEKKNATGTVVEQVAANEKSPDGSIEFECRDNGTVILLYAWRDGAALAVSWIAGVRQPEQILNEGDLLSLKGPGGAPLELRLDQVLLQALPVPSRPDGPKTLALDTPVGAMRLREGASRQIKETRLIYRRQREAPQVRYGLRASFGKDRPAQEFTLDPDGKQRIDTWRITQDLDNPKADRLAALRVRRIPITFGQYLAALLFFAGAAGMLMLRFGIRRPLPVESAPFDPGQGWTTVTDNPPQQDPEENEEDKSVVGQLESREGD